MKTLMLATLVSLSLGAGLLHADPGAAAYQTHAYQTPAHNYYQNSWMNG